MFSHPSPWALACAAALGTPPAHADAGAGLRWHDVHGEIRAVAQAVAANPQGPHAQAVALAPEAHAAPSGRQRAELGLRGTLRDRALPLSLHADVALEQVRSAGHVHAARATVKELNLDAVLGAWQASAGRRIVSWDVGLAFRPNDMVQQEVRRPLLSSSTPGGRAVLQLERFGSDDALSLVWAQPQHLHDRTDRHRGAEESAWAAHAWRRQGSADWHGFARWGEHTRASVGAALAWVTSDETELHASLRWLQRHDGVRLDGQAAVPAQANPWQDATLGAARQALVGASWTGTQQISLLAEWWHDGTAPSAATWRAWRSREQALVAWAARPGLPTAATQAAAGNLAWLASSLQLPTLQRENLYLRAAWQPDAWLLSADWLWQPADGGHVASLGARWQGDRCQAELAWRWQGGPDSALLARLPTRQTGALALSRRY